MTNKPQFTPSLTAQASHAMCVSLTPARYIVVDEFAVELDPSKVKVCAPGTTIRDLTLGISGPVVCSVNGVYLSRDVWDTEVRPGELLVVQQLPQGGGGGSNLRTVLQLVVMVVAMVVPGMQAFAGWSAAAQAGLGAAINMVGMLAINALVPLPKANANQQSGESASPTYNVQLGGNSVRIDQAIPVGYGQCLQRPDFAAQPYQVYVNNEQIYHAILSMGRGKYEVLRTLIDDTDIRTFEDVTIAYVGPGQEFATLADQNLVDPGMVTVPEVSAQELKDPGKFVGPFNMTKAGYLVNQVSFDFAFPQGLGNVQDDGGISSRSVDFVVQVRSINEYDRPTNGWQVLDRFTHTAATTKPQQFTKTYNVNPARYQCRVARIDAYSDNNRHLNRCNWVSARARLVKGIERDPNNTYLVLKIRASDQMSQMSQRQIGVEWRKHIPVYKNGEWVTEFSRNPAWAIHDMLTDTDYGMSLERSRVDLAALQRFAATCDRRQDRFDYIFDTQTTALEAANLIARVGRAVVFQRSGVYTVVRDQAQSLQVAQFTEQDPAEPDALITPHIIKSGTFKSEITMPSEVMPQAFRLSFRDGILNDDRVVIAQVHNDQIYGYHQGMRPADLPVPERYSDFRMSGIVGRTHAMREALYLAASTCWRRVRASFTTTTAGLLPAYGSLVEVVHDSMSWGQSSEVLSYDPATLKIISAAPLNWTAGEQHNARFSARTGDVSPLIQVSRGLFDNELILSSPLPFDPVTDDTDEASHLSRTRFSFGTSVAMSQFVRVKELKPNAKLEVAMRCVLEDNRVHHVDDHLLPAPGEDQDPLNDGYFDPSNEIYENPALSRLYRNKPDQIQVGRSANSATFTFRPDGTWAFTHQLPVLGPEQIDNADDGYYRPVTGWESGTTELGTWASKTIDPDLVGVDLEYRIAPLHTAAASNWFFGDFGPWTTFSNEFSVTQNGFMNNYGGDTQEPYWQKTEIYVQIRRRDTFTLVFDSRAQADVYYMNPNQTIVWS